VSTEHTPEGTPDGAPEGRTPDGTAPEAGTPAGSGPGGGTRGEDTRGESGSGAAPRRRYSSLIAASVAVAVLLAGGGVAYWASSAPGGADGTRGTAAGRSDPPPLELGGYAEGDGWAIAPGEPNPSGGSYRAAGELPDGPDSAPVYRLTGEVTRAQVERLARALGVAGRPRLEQDTWKLGPTGDASGPTLLVAKQAPGTWTYARYGGSAGTCTEPAPPEEPAKPSQDADSPVSPRCPAPGETPAGPAGGATKPVSEEAAERAAAPVLEAVGLGGAQLDAGTTSGAVRTVNANPVVGGLPTYGWHTGLQIGADGRVMTGSGPLAAPARGADYPVLGAQETLERLNDLGGSGWADIGGCASPVPLVESSGPVRPEILPCGSAEPALPEPATVRSADFGLAVYAIGTGQALVPSWLFEVEQPGATGPRSTYTVTHPAVRPQYIAQPSPGRADPGGGADGTAEEPLGPGRSQMHIESYSVDGRTLSLHFWGGVCSAYSASVEESATAVTARITGEEINQGRACIMIAQEFEEKVTLDEPLGDRKVLDAGTGETVPKR
jgi:hypothetical protein